jgi:tetratricopeptide (TPR) repeat protein
MRRFTGQQSMSRSQFCNPLARPAAHAVANKQSRLALAITSCVFGLTAFGGVLSVADAKAGEPEKKAQPAAKNQTAKAARPITAKPIVASDTRMLEFLIAELAAQRGDGEVATSVMLDLARKQRDPALAKRALEIAHRSNRVNDARGAAALWSELETEGQGAQYLADLLASEGTLEAASQSAQKMIAQAVGRGDRTAAAAYLMQLNVLLSRYPDKKKVRIEIDRIAALYPGFGQAYYSRAWAAYIAGDYLAANANADQTLKLEPEWENAAMAKMAALKKLQESSAKATSKASAAGEATTQSDASQAPLTSAAEFAQAFLERNPKSINVRHMFARELVSERRVTDARDQFKQLVTARKDDVQYIMSLGMIEQQLGNLSEAESHFLKALTFPVVDEDLLFQSLAQVAEARNNYPQAIDWLKRLVNSGRSNNSAVLRQVALLTAKSEGLTQGLAALAEVPRESKTEKIAFALAEAQMYREAKQLQPAFAALEASVKEFSDEPELLYDYAMSAERIGKLSEMETALRKVIKLKPDFAHAYNALGYSFVDRNIRLAEARVLLEKAVALAPDDAFIIDSLGWLYFRMGKLDDAQKQLEAAYALRPDAEIAAHLSEVLLAKGDVEAAKQLLAGALQKYPDNESLVATATRLKLKP